MGDLLRRRELILLSGGKPPLTNPECVFTPNKALILDTDETDWSGVGLTAYLPVAKNNTFKYYNPVPSPDVQTTDTGLIGFIRVTNGAYTQTDWWNCRCDGSERSITCDTGEGTSGYVRLNIIMDGLADSYAYNATTGMVYYAGINTPYYGKTNIND